MFPSLIHILFTFAHLYFERARLSTMNGNRRLVQEPRGDSAKPPSSAPARCPQAFWTTGIAFR
jgi:hypothetical protein